jgi:hypothetical protein
MQQETERIHGNLITREGVRRVLIEQYTFHEPKHLSEAEGGAIDQCATVPEAHAIADIYKCLHQGEFGIGHSIEDPFKFAGLLTAELLSARRTADEPILENVSPNGAVFRINLRPYRQRFLGRERSASGLLSTVCLNSAAAHQGSEKDFMAALEWFRDLNDSRELAIGDRFYVFPGELVRLFLLQVKDFIKTTGKIPVLSHSPVYKKFNAPSYRVVDRNTLEHSELAFLIQEPQ